MTDALDAFAETLTQRVNAYWADCEDCDMWSGVENRFGSAVDWDDTKEGAYFLWRKEGWDPDLELPRPSLLNPRDDASFRSSVAFEDFDTRYWFSSSTAIFFATMNWGSLQSDDVTVMPSLGQTRQDASGLMGAWKLTIQDPRPHMTWPHGDQSRPRTWSIVDLGWSAYGTWPIWEDLASALSGGDTGIDGVPWYYRDDVDSLDHGFTSRDELLVFLLPDDLRTPYLLPLGSVISYSLGWLALTHGLTVIVNEWQGINEVLASIPLQGFAPAT